MSRFCVALTRCPALLLPAAGLILTLAPACGTPASAEGTESSSNEAMAAPSRDTTAEDHLSEPLLAGGLSLSTWRVELAAWQSEREAGLKDPQGSLALAGLAWLREGPNRFGSAPENDVVLPAGPEFAGVLTLADGEVEIDVNAGVAVTHEGDAVASLHLASDSGGDPTRLRMGRLSFWIIDRPGQVGVRVRDPRSPVLAAYDGTPRWAADPSWRLAARYIMDAQPGALDLPNILGSTFVAERYGVLRFERDGQTHELIVSGADDDALFVIFADQSNGPESYGGGRFLEVPAPLAGEHTVIDFNRAYNPPCAYSPFSTCPLPPEGNRLALNVAAGEKAWQAP